MKRFLSIILAACLLVGTLPFTASAAETVTLTATKTDVKADSVVNYGGYGSLKIEGDYDMGVGQIKAHPQVALMDKTGKLVMAYRESYNIFHYSDGIISLTSDSPNSSAKDNLAPSGGFLNTTPQFYSADGSKLFALDGAQSNPMRDGYAVVYANFDMDMQTLDAYVIDSTGKKVCDLPAEFGEITTFGAGGVDTKYAVGWFGEGLVMYYEGHYESTEPDNPEDDVYYPPAFVTTVLGYMDSTGKTVIDLSDRDYTNAWPFHEGLACVLGADGVYRYIDKTGTEVLSLDDPYYDAHGHEFCGGLAVVENQGMYGFIDTSGKVVIPFDYTGAFNGGDGEFLAVRSGATTDHGLIDRNNQVVLPFEYDNISAFENGVAYAVKDGYVYVITKQAQKPTVGGFNDVFEGDYYADPVVWAVENNITSGVGNGKFAPNSNCTREQIVTFLWRANGSPEPETTVNPFTDVGQSSYAYKAILWAVENNITGGTGNGKFSPGASCTRDQAVTFLWRSEGKPTAASGSSFTDVKTGDYFANAVAWAVENNITGGVGNNRFNPKGTCTRGQIVTFLYRNK